MMRVRSVDRFLIFCALAFLPITAPCASAPKTSEAKTLNASAWPKRTSLILKLDGTDRYFFPVSTKLDGLQKDKIATLLNQGEFAVIQERLKNQPDQLKRYRSCLDYETSSAGRSNSSKKGYSLEVIATLCLASKSTSIDSKGYIHVLKSDKTPETLLISSNDPNYNSALDIGIPSLNATKDKNGHYAGDAKRTLPDYCGGAFADPKACMKVCEKNIDAPICRSCSRFDSGDTKFVNLKGMNTAPLVQLYNVLGKRSDKTENDYVSAQVYLEPEALTEAYKQTGFDISQIRMFKTAMVDVQSKRNTEIFSTCFPCPKDAKIDKTGKCLKDGCDIGAMVANGKRCKSKKDCESYEVLIDGECKNTCARECSLQLNEAESNLRSLSANIEDIKNQHFSNVSGAARVAEKYGLSEVLQRFEAARRTVLERKNKIEQQVKSCDRQSAELKCDFYWITSSDIFERLEAENGCGPGKFKINGMCADQSCAICTESYGYRPLMTRSNLGECKTPELQLAWQLLQERFNHSSTLLFDQCVADPQVAKQCEAIRNPSDQEIAELLKGYGVICFPNQSGVTQAAPE